MTKNSIFQENNSEPIILTIAEYNPDYMKATDAGHRNAIHIVRLSTNAEGKPRFRLQTVDSFHLDKPSENEGEHDGPSLVGGIARVSFYHRHRPDLPILVLDGAPRREVDLKSWLSPSRIDLNLWIRAPIATNFGFFAEIHASDQGDDDVVRIRKGTFDTSRSWLKTWNKDLYELGDFCQLSASFGKKDALPPIDGDNPASLAILERLGIHGAVHGYPGDDWLTRTGTKTPHVRRRLFAGLVNGPPLPSARDGDECPPTLELVLSRRVGFSSPARLGGRGGPENAVPLPFKPRVLEGAPQQRLLEHDQPGHTLVARQPPLTCTQHRRIDDPIVWFVGLQGFKTSQIFDAWKNDVVDAYHASLRSARSDRPLSLLPRMDPKEDEQTWTLTFRVADKISLNDKGAISRKPVVYDQDVQLVVVSQNSLRDLYPDLSGKGRNDGWTSHQNDVATKGCDATQDDDEQAGVAVQAKTPQWRSTIGSPVEWTFEIGSNSWEGIDEGARVSRLMALAWSEERIVRDAEYGQESTAGAPDPTRTPPPPAIELKIKRMRAEGSDIQVRLGAFDLVLEGDASTDDQNQIDDASGGKPGPAAAGSPVGAPNVVQAEWESDATDWRKREAGRSSSDDTIQIWWRRDTYHNAFSIYVNFDVVVPVAGLSIGSQDPTDLENEEFDVEVPILIPREVPSSGDQEADGKEAPGAGRVRLGLNLQEFATERKKQQVVMNLFSTSSEALPELRVIVIDTAPFFIAEVVLGELRPTGENNRLAYFDSDLGESAVWSLRSDRRGDGFRLRLPPQAIGETALKGPRSATDHELPEGEFADFRFGPPATIQVDTVYRADRREAVETPTNTRRIFGQATNAGRGAPLRRARLELLYGLASEIEEVPGLQLLELVAEQGDTPLPLPTRRDFHDYQFREKSDFCEHIPSEDSCCEISFSRRYGNYRKEWEKVRLAFRRRLAILTLTRADVRPMLVDKIGFELRRNAQIRQPVGLADDELTGTPYEKDGGRYQEDGKLHADAPFLAGGAEWGFESSEIYKELWKDPTTSTGEMADIHLSALGGWGYQKARFEKTSIIARVGMGRTHFYSLERIGRIGCFWNRAKHVIIYERTVLPSTQFGGKQPDHVGRPILRKVKEFVEILEPERRFPDIAGDTRLRGFVEAIVFRSTIIPVDSAWGSDIPNIGWKIPLWMPGATPASVYPRPQIELRLAADPRDGAGSTLAAIAEPQNLVFFTDTNADSGTDTDKWRTVPGVDFVPLPAPKQPEVPTHAPDDADAILTNDVAVPPGFSATTFRLEPLTEAPVHLTAERNTRERLQQPQTEEEGQGSSRAGSSRPAISAVLRTVTMSRGGGVLGEVDLSFIDQLRDLGYAVPDALARISKAAATAANATSDPAKRFENALQSAKNALADAQKSLQEKTKETQAPLLEKIKGAQNSLRKKTEETRKHLRKKIGETGPDPKAGIANICDHISQLIVVNKKNYNESVDHLFESIKENLKKLANIKDITSNDIKDRLNNIDGQADQLFMRLDSEIARLFPSITNFRAQISPNIIEKLRRSTIASIGNLEQRLDSNLSSTSSKMRDNLVQQRSALLAEFDHNTESLLGDIQRRAPGLSSTLEKGRLKIRENLATSLTKCSLDIEAATRTGRDAAQTVIDDLAKSVRELVEDESTFSDLKTCLAGISSELKTATDAADMWIANIRNKLQESEEAIREKIEGARIRIGEINEEKEKITTFVNEEINSIIDQIDTTKHSIKSIVDNIDSRSIEGGCKKAIFKTNDKKKLIENYLEEAVGAIGEKALDERFSLLFGNIKSEEGAEALIARLENQSLAIASQLQSALDRALEERLAAVSEVDLENLRQDVTDGAMKLLRGFGDAPAVPGLEFNRQQLGYYFEAVGDEVADALAMTPAAALFDRAGDALKGLGMRMPTKELTERFVPDLGKLDVSTLFPDIAGIKLDDLFPAIRPGDDADDRVRVTHGFDKETRRGWIDAKINEVTIDNEAPLFEFAGLALKLKGGVFDAEARLETDLSGAANQLAAGQVPTSVPTSRNAKGEIKGDWELSFGGKMLVTFAETPLTFDADGGLNFPIKMDNTKLSPELSFLDQFLSNTPSNVGGFTVGVLQEGLVPVGVECLLDLPVPPMVFGTFGVSGLRFITGLQVRAIKEFSITAHAALGAQAQPFTITICVLGGTGWIQTWGRYTPSAGELESSVSIAIGVSAQLGFNFGPINGDVQLILALKGELRSSNKNEGSLSVSILMIARGQVDVAGLITAALMLMLEVRFEDGQRVIAEGTAMFSIRMGPFYTWRISERVTYRLAGKGDNRSDGPAARHVNSSV